MPPGFFGGVFSWTLSPLGRRSPVLRGCFRESYVLTSLCIIRAEISALCPWMAPRDAALFGWWFFFSWILPLRFWRSPFLWGCLERATWKLVPVKLASFDCAYVV